MSILLHAGHFALDEQPDLVADLTRTFLLGKLAGASPPERS